MKRLTRDGTAGSVSRDRILRRERGQGEITFFSVQLNTSRIGNFTRHILLLLLLLLTITITITRRERGQGEITLFSVQLTTSRIGNFTRRTGTGGNNTFLCSADHEQDWQLYPTTIGEPV